MASVDQLTPEKLGRAELVEEVQTADRKMVKITGVPPGVKTVTVLVRGSNKLVRPLSHLLTHPTSWCKDNLYACGL